MKQHYFRISIFFIAFSYLMINNLQAQQLRISENNKYLVSSDGVPFFWLGDTAWELFHRLDRKEADQYLKDRASKGFTVIQAVALAELKGLDVPNPYGELPLIDKDPAKPNKNYFKHVDYIIKKGQFFRNIYWAATHLGR